MKEIQTKFQIKRGSDGKFVGLDLSRDREARTIKVTCETKIVQLLETYGLELSQEVHSLCAWCPDVPRLHVREGGHR